MGQEPSCSPRKKTRREASGGASKASERSLEQTKFPHEDPASAERHSTRLAVCVHDMLVRFLRA